MGKIGRYQEHMSCVPADTQPQQWWTQWRQNNPKEIVGKTDQESFCVFAEPMRNNITM